VHRGLLSPLAPGVYRLPANSTVLREALLKEAVHDLGHAPPLAHCEDYQCVMLPSRGVEWIDLKTSQIRARCRDESLGWGVASG
jgi:archaemetzincin